MHDFPPNINWRFTTLLATVLGYAICDNFTAREQIAVGHWVLQIGQTVVSNATYQQMIESRILGEEKINLNSREFKSGKSPFLKSNMPNWQHFYQTFKSQISEEDFKNLQKAIQKINEELEKIKKEMTNY